jgi:hypothetical protein
VRRKKARTATSRTAEDEVPLTGGGRTAVTRRGDVVVRETGPWAPAVHALLRHLQRVGFDGAPRVVGTGLDAAGRETLSYIEGEMVNPAPWSDDAMVALGRMIRRLHDATASFRPPANAAWRAWFGRDLGESDRIIGHCDAAPWNIVARDRKPVALIDWEVAGPVDRLTDVAMASWANAQLYDDDDVVAMNGLPDAAARMRQVRLFVDAYGLRARERKQLSERIIAFAALSAANETVEQKITPETTHAPRVWGIAWQTRSVAWIIRNRPLLDRALA